MSASTYNHLVTDSKVEIGCSFCETKLLPKSYLGHLKELHKEKIVGNICIWCMDFTWRKQDKSVNNYEHRIKCLR